MPVRTELGLPRRRAALGRVPRLEERSAFCPPAQSPPGARARLGPELGACSGSSGARERTQERRRPVPAPRAEQLRRSPEQLAALLPTSSPWGSGTKVWASEKAQVGTLTGLFGTPGRTRGLRHPPLYPACPPGLGSCQRPWGGGQDCGCAPLSPHDGPKLVSPASLSILQAQREPQGL